MRWRRTGAAQAGTDGPTGQRSSAAAGAPLGREAAFTSTSSASVSTAARTSAHTAGTGPITGAPAARSGVVAIQGAAPSASSVSSPIATASRATVAPCACCRASTTGPSPVTAWSSPRPTWVGPGPPGRAGAWRAPGQGDAGVVTQDGLVEAAPGHLADEPRAFEDSFSRSIGRVCESPATTTSAGSSRVTALSTAAATSAVFCRQTSSVRRCQRGCFQSPNPPLTLCWSKVSPLMRSSSSAVAGWRAGTRGSRRRPCRPARPGTADRSDGGRRGARGRARPRRRSPRHRAGGRGAPREHELAVVDEHVPGDRGRHPRLLLETRRRSCRRPRRARALGAEGLLDGAELQRGLPSRVLDVAGHVGVGPRPRAPPSSRSPRTLRSSLVAFVVVMTAPLGGARGVTTPTCRVRPTIPGGPDASTARSRHPSRPGRGAPSGQVTSSREKP